jgi:hypothetical protein
LPEEAKQRLGRIARPVMMDSTPRRKTPWRCCPCLADVRPNPEDKKAFEAARKRKGRATLSNQTWETRSGVHALIELRLSRPAGERAGPLS